MVVNGNVIERVSTFKYLGLMLDECLTFKCHFEHVYKKISVNAGLICKLRKNITAHVLMLLINAYINSVIDYSLIIWGASRVNDFERLQKVTYNILATYYYPKSCKFKHKRFWANLSPSEAKKARRECDKMFKAIDFSMLLEKHNLLTLGERFQFFSVWFIYKIRKFGCKIPHLTELFVPTSNSCNMTTRNRNSCNIQPHCSALYANSFGYSASKVWNSLPRELCEIKGKSVNFRKSVNQWLIKKW